MFFNRKTWIFLLTAVFIAAGFPACLFPAETSRELLSNPSFTGGAKGWRRYENFVAGDPAGDWSLSFTPNGAVITGTHCQPQTRVGFRSDPAPLPSSSQKDVPWLITARVEWRGKGIHRSGIYIIMTDAGGNALRQAEICGPAGDFDTTEVLHLAWDSASSPEGASLLTYVFHDGVGELTVRRISLTLEPLPKDGTGPLAGPAPDRRTAKSTFSVIVNELSPPWPASIPFPGITSASPRIPGETRFFRAGGSATGGKNAQGYRIGQRDIARFWEFESAWRVPWWLEPASGSNAEVLRIAGETDGATDSIPPLPRERAAYLYYYGAFRYGKKPSDLEQDKKEFHFLRRAGFTGLCIQDDYGLDYARFVKGEPLDPAFMLAAAEAYKDAGFPSPLIFGPFMGLDRGRVTWAESDDRMEEYLKALAPHIRAAMEILGPERLWIAPVDEPNEPRRREAVVKLLPLWQRRIPAPLMITANWKTAGVLAAGDSVPGVHLWLGAGDHPSFHHPRMAYIHGFYAGLDSWAPPLRFRYLGGVYAWASGLRSQAWWHFMDVSGKWESDLDGIKPDYMCTRPGDPLTTPALSFPFACLLEGLEDLRLLCAIESAAEGRTDDASGQAREFLDRTRRAVLPSDRLSPFWESPEQFEKMRSEAAGIWKALMSTRTRNNPGLITGRP
ncbi:MAG TPA: hypothetical protein PLB62_05345 [Candidatus Sumerlaeota bacterium]|nr:hypothetical protein [Candidatus Sumerlaeota bacterium]